MPRVSTFHGIDIYVYHDEADHQAGHTSTLAIPDARRRSQSTAKFSAATCQVDSSI